MAADVHMYKPRIGVVYSRENILPDALLKEHQSVVSIGDLKLCWWTPSYSEPGSQPWGYDSLLTFPEFIQKVILPLMCDENATTRFLAEPGLEGKYKQAVDTYQSLKATAQSIRLNDIGAFLDDHSLHSRLYQALLVSDVDALEGIHSDGAAILSGIDNQGISLHLQLIRAGSVVEIATSTADLISKVMQSATGYHWRGSHGWKSPEFVEIYRQSLEFEQNVLTPLVKEYFDNVFQTFCRSEDFRTIERTVFD